MGRKLIQHGKSSLTLSLPRKWIKEKNLKKGCEVEVEESNGKLIVSTQKHQDHKKIDIDISGAEPMIRKMIGATFKSGYDEVNIAFNSYEELKAVQDVVREQFTGFEIVNQTKNNITIKNLLQTNFEEFNNVLRRFFLVLNHMASETCNALKKNDFKWLKNTALQKIESDKFADYCRRAINMSFETEFKRVAPLYTVVEQLEKIADRYRDLCEYVSVNKIKVNNKIKSFMRELAEFQENFYSLFYRFEIKKMIEFGKNKELLQKKLDKIATQCSKKEIKIIILVNRILNLIFDLNGPLMAVHI